MKVKNMRICIRSLRDSLQLFGEAYETLQRGEKVIPRHELAFPDAEALRTVLTNRRLELLHIIRRQSPPSVYALAHLVDRDLKSVNTDLRVLVNLGLVELEHIQEARKKVKPIVTYDKLNVEIQL